MNEKILILTLSLRIDENLFVISKNESLFIKTAILR